MNIKSLFIRLFFGLGFIIIGIGFLLNYHYDIDISGYVALFKGGKFYMRDLDRETGLTTFKRYNVRWSDVKSR